MSGIQFETVEPIGPQPEPAQPGIELQADLIEHVQARADYLRGQADAYLEFLGLLEGSRDDNEPEAG